MKSFSYHSYTSTFSTPNHVLDHMFQIGEEVIDTNLQHVGVFNTTYAVITKNVLARLGKKYFDDDLLMKKLDIQFGKYYFDALQLFVKTKKTTPAWEILFDEAKDHPFSFIQMALGVNAHVNNDLPFTLFDTIKDVSYKADYDRVNKIIYESLTEVMGEFKENNIRLEKMKGTTLYYRYLDLLIRKWRENAWKKYLLLRDNKITKEEIEQEAYQIGKKLLVVRNISDLPNLITLLR